MVPQNGPKRLFKYGENRPFVSYCTQEEKLNFGCYEDQPQPFEVVVYSIDANSSCSFIKQDLILKQEYLVSFSFVLCNKLKF